MIFVFCFIMLLAFVLYKKTYKVGIVKSKKKFKLASKLNLQVFYLSKLNLFNEESKLLLASHGISFSKKVDNILNKVRLNCPSHFLQKKEREFFYEKLKEKPVYVAKSKKDFLPLETALRIEDFYAVYFDNISKKDEIFEPNKVFIASSKNKLFKEVLENLNINKPLPKKIDILFKADQFLFKQNLKKTSILTQGYLLEKYQSQEIDFFVYKLFVGECVSFVSVKNKTQNDVNFAFDLFFDFANKKINYFAFDVKNNFVSIKNQKTGESVYFNFSLPAQKTTFSAIKGTTISNLPCLYLNYNFEIKQNRAKTMFFMFSKRVQPLPLLDVKKLMQVSHNKLSEIFLFSINFFSNKENSFFEKIKTKAKICLLQSVDVLFSWHKGNYVELKQKYKNKEIDALCFYLSVKHNAYQVLAKEIVVNTQFFAGSFEVFFGNVFKSVMVSKKNLAVPYLLLEGVKYFNQFAVPVDFLKRKPAQILVWKFFMGV